MGLRSEHLLAIILAISIYTNWVMNLGKLVENNLKLMWNFRDSRLDNEMERWIFPYSELRVRRVTRVWRVCRDPQAYPQSCQATLRPSSDPRNNVNQRKVIFNQLLLEKTIIATFSVLLYFIIIIQMYSCSCIYSVRRTFLAIVFWLF